MLAFFKGKPWGGWAWCLFLIISGFGCHAIIMATNLLQGLHMGQDDQSSMIYGAGALAIDLFGVGICSAIAGARKRQGQSAFKWNCIIGASALLSLVMFFGYNAANRIEPVKVAQQEHANKLTALAKAEALSKENRESGLKFAREQANLFSSKATDRKLSPEQRAAAEKQANDWAARAQTGSFSDVHVEVAPVEINKDPMAAVLSEKSGLEISTIQSLQACFMCGLVLLIGSAMIRYGFESLPHYDPKALAAAAAAERKAEEEERAAARKAMEEQRRVLLENNRNFSVIAGGRPSGIKQIEGTVQIMEWLETSTTEDASAEVLPADLHKSYLMYARHNSYHEMNVSDFGRAIKRLNDLGKIHLPARSAASGGANKAKRVYIGRALRTDVAWVKNFNPRLRSVG